MSFVKISKLDPSSRGFNIKVKIFEKESDKVVTIKKTQIPNRVASFRVGDDTGTLKLTVWGAEIDRIPVGKVIKIEKSYVSEFNKGLQLNIGKFSKWSVLEEELDALDITPQKKAKKGPIKVCNVIIQKKGIDLARVKLVEVGNVRNVKFKKDGSSHEVADALIGDETGCIKCSLWDEDIKKLEEGMILHIHNAYISEYRGIPQLNLSRFSRYDILEPEDINVDLDNNLSLVERVA